MSAHRDRWFALFISLCVLLLVTIPYLLAVRSAGTDYEFSGFLLNPLDGHSYLSKMFQGWEGNWRFRLPYTADPGEGAYLFLFYLFLGHLARIVNLPLLAVFHAARILGSAFLLWALWWYFGALIPPSRPRKLAFALAAFGSGVGWLLLPLGALTSDFWVAEAYPFLSDFANPHFPIGLALVLCLVIPLHGRTLRRRDAAAFGIGSLILSVVNPFGVVIALMALVGELLWRMVKRSWPRVLFQRIFIMALCGLPFLVYDFWVTVTDPIFAGWNSQNLTPSPSLWDLLASLSPAFILAILAVWKLLRLPGENINRDDKPALNWVPLLVWAGLGLILMYIPVSLQRRFMMGLYVPLAALAAIGLEILASGKPKRFQTTVIALFVLALPTNLVILLATLQGIQTHDPKIYLSRGEMEALNWITENTNPDTLVLSGPEMGLFIPAYTGRRVIYGHPYETVDADTQERAVTEFFTGEIPPQKRESFLTKQGVDILFYGDRERALGEIQPPISWRVIFESSTVTLFAPRIP